GFLGLTGLSGVPRKNSLPLFIYTLTWFSNLFGGTKQVISVVLTFYPVVIALIVSLVMYFATRKITDDERIALTTVFTLALMYTFMFRTSLGYPDHHAFDYLWMSLTFFSVVYLHGYEGRFSNSRNVGLSVLLGLSLAGQTLSWNASPLILAPLGFYIAIKVLGDLDGSRSPFWGNVELVSGIGLGALISLAFNQIYGWQSTFTILSVVLFFGLALSLTCLGHIFNRKDYGPRLMAVTEGVIFVAGVVSVMTIFSDLMDRFTRGVNELAGEQQQLIIETNSIFSSPVRPLSLFGLFFVLGLATLAGLALLEFRQRRNSRMLVLIVYGFYFLVMSGIQGRFSGELSLFLAVFSGVGFIYICSLIDIAEKPAFLEGSQFEGFYAKPTANELVSFGIIFLIIASYSLLLTPTLVESSGITESEYRIVENISEYSEENGVEYPRNYVMSPWDRNRMYNYFVNGHAHNYTFASNRYGEFLTSEKPKKQYNIFRRHDRNGFVVIYSEDAENVPKESNYYNLYLGNGSNVRNLNGLYHYRMMYNTGQERAPKTYFTDDGYFLNGSAEPG
ncbi:MAG: hypothetical protein ABEK59_05815, partial [Halobacteria archaeon]